MQREWQRQFSDRLAESRSLTPANQLVLAYQFERARVEHPEGFTLDIDGCLYDADAGYAVSVTPDSFISVADALDTLARIQDAHGFRNLYLGYWKDDEREYIDVTMVTHSWEMAEALGRTYRQVAVWDFATERAIRFDDLDGLATAA